MIVRYSTKINLIKDFTLPNIEKNIKKLEDNGLSAIREFRASTFKIARGKGVLEYQVTDARVVSTHNTYNVCEPNKVYLVIENWESLSKNMKKQFWRMQRTLFRFDRYLIQKDLKEYRKQLAHSKRIVEKLSRLSEEEIKIYYKDMLEGQT